MSVLQKRPERRPMTGSIQMCPECGSPLRPCKCDRPKKKPRRMKSRSFKAVHADNPLVYGPIFEEIRRLARTGACILAGETDFETGQEHVCQDVWRATAHHSPHVGSGGTDRSCGPVCGLADDYCHGRLWGWSEGMILLRFRFHVSKACRM